jgi:hypothetical protein
VRRCEVKELCPTNNGIHLRQKRTLKGAFGGEFKSGCGEAELFHVDSTFLRRDLMTGFCRYSLSQFWFGLPPFDPMLSELPGFQNSVD